MLVMAWLLPLYIERGQSSRSGGFLLAELPFGEALTALGLAAFVHHFPNQRGLLISCLFLVLAALSCILV